ncbi:MAG: Guanylate kinase, partial [uncultured Rubellimicrobium sp.]
GRPRERNSPGAPDHPVLPLGRWKDHTGAAAARGGPDGWLLRIRHHPRAPARRGRWPRIPLRHPAQVRGHGGSRRSSGACRGFRQSLRLPARTYRGRDGAGARYAVRHRLAGWPADPQFPPWARGGVDLHPAPLHGRAGAAAPQSWPRLGRGHLGPHGAQHGRGQPLGRVRLCPREPRPRGDRSQGAPDRRSRTAPARASALAHRLRARPGRRVPGRVV